MERNRWETAIRCLEIALHPHTADDEVIAAVNGFRRTADRTPLSEICRAFAGADHPPLDRLIRENRALRRRLEEAESRRNDLEQYLDEAARRGRDLEAELLAARHRADALAEEFAEFRAACAERRDEERQEQARQSARDEAASPPHRPAPSFRKMLAEARLKADAWSA